MILALAVLFLSASPPEWVLVLVGCGAIEVALRHVRSAGRGVASVHGWPLLATAGAASGGLLAALVAFAPSFSFILIGAERFDRLRANQSVRAFLNGAGPAAIGAIAGAAIPLALALTETWQLAILAAADR